MPKFWDSFQVYNKNKHEKNPEMFGGNQSNVSGGNTKYQYSQEYYETKSKPVPATIGSEKSVVVEPVRRKSSVASQGSMGQPLLNPLDQGKDNTMPQDSGHSTMGSGFGKDQHINTNEILGQLNPITRSEISKLSQNEFQQVYNNLKRGEPNNNVNF